MSVAVAPLAQSLDSPDWTLLRNLGIGLVVVLWLATAYWTFKDARRRIEDPWLVATRSSSDRSLPAEDLAPLARLHFDHVEVVEDPIGALARGHELGEPVLVTGSLYVLGDIAQEERRTAWRG